MTSQVAQPTRIVADFALQRKGAAIAAALLAIVSLAAFFAPLISPQNPFDLTSFDLLDAELPPFWLDGSEPSFVLGTDPQGRDLFSAILYGTRISLLVGLAAVVIQASIGIPLGLFAMPVPNRCLRTEPYNQLLLYILWNTASDAR